MRPELDRGPLRDLNPACSLARGRARLERLISIHHLLCHCLFLGWQFVTLATQVSAVGRSHHSGDGDLGVQAEGRPPATHRSEVPIPRERLGQNEVELTGVMNG